MKYTITINQSAVFSSGLIHKTDIVDWAIIDYLKDFAIYKKSKRIYVDNEPSPSPSTNQSSKSARSKYLQTISRDNITQEGRGEEYIWLNYNHLIMSLPLLQFKTKAALSKRINKLRQLELIKTYQTIDNTLFYTFTDKMIDICFARQSDIDRMKDQNSDPVIPKLTPPVIPKLTAQYKTKISIINKDTNRNTSSFSSSLKPNNKQIKPRINTNKHRLELNTENTESTERKNSALSATSAVKNIKGFTSMNNIWTVVGNIRQRQQITTKTRNNKEITKTELFCHPERSEGSQSEILRENPQNDKFFVGSSNACVRG